MSTPSAYQATQEKEERLGQESNVLGDGGALAAEEQLAALGHGVLDLLLEEAQLKKKKKKTHARQLNTAQTHRHTHGLVGGRPGSRG
jgi:hypothetical protein